MGKMDRSNPNLPSYHRVTRHKEDDISPSALNAARMLMQESWGRDKDLLLDGAKIVEKYRAGLREVMLTMRMETDPAEATRAIEILDAADAKILLEDEAAIAALEVFHDADSREAA